MTATLLTTLVLDGNGLTVLPLVIVSAVVSYVLTVRLNPPAVRRSGRAGSAIRPATARERPRVRMI